MNFAKYRVQLSTEKKYSSKYEYKYEYEYSIPGETSVKLLLSCITQSLSIQIHFYLLYWLASFCISINSGVAFSLLFST